MPNLIQLILTCQNWFLKLIDEILPPLLRSCPRFVSEARGGDLVHGRRYQRTELRACITCK